MHRDTIYVDGKPLIYLDLELASFYTLFNSPYYPHSIASAIDIYFNSDEALFLFEEGRVIEIKWFPIPKIRSDAIDREPMIIIDIGSNTIAKILHVFPKVRVGEKLVYGDPIGNTIVSGYLYPWSEKHMHLELRPLHDRYRVRNAHKIKLLRTREVSSHNTIYGIVADIAKHYILIKPIKSLAHGLTPLFIEFNSNKLFFEGGYPHYKIAALHGGKCINRNNTICIDVGYYNTSIIKKSRNLEIKLYGITIDGISTYIGREYIKLVSNNIFNNISIGDVIEIDINRILDL
ncbi:MAG TPA: hypothetical protein ENF93_02070 [Ignisphaera sp.]|nr:hypothetical protein [Ignisphaera sp.]